MVGIAVALADFGCAGHEGGRWVLLKLHLIARGLKQALVEGVAHHSLIELREAMTGGKQLRDGRAQGLRI